MSYIGTGGLLTDWGVALSTGTPVASQPTVSAQIKAYAPPATASNAGSPGVLSKIGDALLSGLNFYGKAQENAGAAAFLNAQYAAPPPPSTPSWVMPVAIGGVALIAVVLLTRK